MKFVLPVVAVMRAAFRDKGRLLGCLLFAWTSDCRKEGLLGMRRDVLACDRMSERDLTAWVVLAGGRAQDISTQLKCADG